MAPTLVPEARFSFGQHQKHVIKRKAGSGDESTQRLRTYDGHPHLLWRRIDVHQLNGTVKIAKIFKVAYSEEESLVGSVVSL